jgi:NTP pyrophosphatase (non-canonical NTP hydrolase)
MNLEDYQRLAKRTANPKDTKNEIFQLLLGLIGESGEVAEKMKKIVRDQGSDFSKVNKDDLTKELGDILWYVAMLADYFDIPFEEVGKKNIEKLASRQARGKLTGSGDNR